MKSRIFLPASIAVVAIAAFALVFCHKSEDEDVKKTPATAPRPIATPSPLVNRKPDTPRPSADNQPALKAQPEKVLTPEEEEKAAGRKALTMFKWMVAYSIDNGGAFPPDTSALMSKNLGFPTDQAGDWLRHVIDYRGRNLTSSDDGRLLLLRYRLGTRTDKEVRVYVSGRTIVVPADEPILEDAPPPPDEAPR